MGKKIVDEDMNLNIIINGDKGKKTLYELEERVHDLNSENEKLERGLQKYEKQIVKNESTLSRYSQTLDKQADREVKQLQICEKAKERYHELSAAYKGLNSAARDSTYGKKMAQDLAKAERLAIQSSRAVMDAREQQKHLQENIGKLSAETEKLRQKRDADTNSLNTNKAAVSEADTKISALRKNLDVTTLSLDELNKEIAVTNAKFRQTDPNDPKWKEYQATLVKLRTRQQELSSQGQQTKGVLCQMADGINKYWSFILGGFYSLKKVFDVIDVAVSKFTEFEDILSDTQKTTGLTKRDVEELNESLKKIDTRTSQEELQGLARVGGKLGIEGKANLEGFVRAADQINVALKEDLGGDTEEAINQVGKLVDIFKVKDNFGIEQGMLKVGSVINELGAASTANEGYIVEFSKRVAGVAPSAGISVSAVMGLGATLDQLGQQSEASSTVYSQMMSKMFKNTAAYANIAGMSLTEFSELMNTDANEAFIRVLEGLKGNNEGMQALVSNLGDMQLNGVRATTILGTLADNTATLRTQQELANEAFQEGTSLTDEFNIKNNNAAAQADKQKKIREELIRDLGQKLQPIMVAGNNTMNTGLQILNTLVGFLVKYGYTLASVSALIAIYTAGMKLSTLANNMHLTSISGVIANLKKLFATLSLNPWGAILTAIAAVGIGIYKLVTYSTDAEKAIQRVADANKGFEKSVAAEQITIDRLFGKLRSATEGTKEWDSARKAITDKYGQYLKDMGVEINSLQDVEKAYKAVSAAARQSAKDRAMEKSAAAAADQYVNVEIEQLSKIRDSFLKKFGDYNGTAWFDQLKKEILSGGDLSKEMQQLVDGFNKTTYVGGGMGPVQSFVLNDIDSSVSQIRKAKSVLEKEMKEIDSIFGDSSMGSVKNSFRDFDQEKIATDAAYKAGEISKKEHEQKMNLIELDHLSERLRKEEMFGNQRFQLEREIAYKMEEIRKKTVRGDYGKGMKVDTPKGALDDAGPDYDAQIIALKAGYAANKLTKDQYEKQLDDLELAHLQFRLKNFEGTEEKRMELQQKIADKQVSIRDKQNKEEQAKENDKSKDYIEALLTDNNTAIQKEELAFKERLHKADLNGKDRSVLMEDQLQALEILEKQHQDNLLKIEEDARKKENDAYMKGITDRIKNMEIAHRMENGQRKSEYYDALDKTDSPGQKRQLTVDFSKDMAGLAENQAGEMIDLLNELLVQMDIDSDVDLGEIVLSPEQKEQVMARLNDVKEKINGLKEISDYAKAKNYGVDILGMDAGQWKVFFEHLGAGKLGIEEMQIAIAAVSAAWSTYDKLKTAQEKKQLKQYEQKTKKEKVALDKQLDAGQISQEQYNARTSQLDTDLDAKKEAIEQKQAARAKRMAIFETIMNLAAGLVQLWVYPGFPAAIPMTAVLGALGAVQIATIAAAQYVRGKYPVTGEDDSRTYQADYAGSNLQTGIYQKPTLGLFSEKEPEMVVDGATTRKLVFNYPQIYQSIMDVSRGRAPQFAEGRYPVTTTKTSSDYDVTTTSDPEMKQLLRANLEMMKALQSKRLEIPWYGRGGIDEKMKKAEKYKQHTTINR